MAYRKSLADVDEEKLIQVEANLHEFTKKIDTVIILPHLKRCLPDDQYTHVRRQCDLQIRVKANQLLWKYLKRAPSWWQCLEDALDKCEYHDLLAIMQSVDP